LTAHDKKRYSYCACFYYKYIDAVIDGKTSSSARKLGHFDVAGEVWL
jgi:hypothetical protein